MASRNINLFQTKSSIQPLFELIEQYIKIVSLSLLTIVLTGSIMVASAFYIFGKQRENMEKDRQVLLQQVKDNVAKESLFLLIRGRLGPGEKILSTQVSYAPFIDTTMKILQSFSLSSFSMGQKNSVSIAVSVTNLVEATKVLTTLMEMEKKKEITSPILQSFSLEEDKIQIGLTYIVVL